MTEIPAEARYQDNVAVAMSMQDELASDGDIDRDEYSDAELREILRDLRDPRTRTWLVDPDLERVLQSKLS